MLLGSGGGVRKQFDKFWYMYLCWDFLQSFQIDPSEICSLIMCILI